MNFFVAIYFALARGQTCRQKQFLYPFSQGQIMRCVVRVVQPSIGVVTAATVAAPTAEGPGQVHSHIELESCSLRLLPAPPREIIW